MRQVFVASIALLLGATVLAQAPDRTARIDWLFQTYVDEGRIAGAVALVLRDGKPIYEKAFGWADKEASRKMTTDTIFRIASQTKAITSTAIMWLVEDGKVAINDPVGRFIPGFAKTTVAVTEGTDVKIVPARRADHRSGICSPTRPASGTAPIEQSPRSIRRKASARPPGSAGTPPTRTSRSARRWRRWRRCRSSPPWRVCLRLQHRHPRLHRRARVRRAARRVHPHALTAPLGMKDTHFFLPPADRDGLRPSTPPGQTARSTRARYGARAGALRRWPSKELRRRRRAAVHGA